MLSLVSRSALIFLLSLAVLGGCVGPRAIRHSREKYNSAVQVTRNEQLLLNLVRLRYRDTPSFLELGSLATQFSFDGAVGTTGTLRENSTNFNILELSAGGGASERPTASYTPLQGAEFVTKLITPIEEETIVLLTRSGWKGERVFRTTVQSLNGLANMRSASGPTPLVVKHGEIEDAYRYRELVRQLEDYSEDGVVRFNYETVETPKSAAIRLDALTPEHAVQAAQNGLKIVHPHEKVAIDINKIQTKSEEVESYVDEELLDDLVVNIKENGIPHPIRVIYDPPPPTDELILQPKSFTVVGDELLFKAAEKINAEDPRQFKFITCDVTDPKNVIVAGTSEKLVMTWDAKDEAAIESLRLPHLTAPKAGRYTMQIEPRSLLGAMFFLSHAISVPLEHQACGLTVVTTDEAGQVFEWTDISGDLLNVKCCKEKPKCAAVAVKYRCHWFYIDDRDHSSKATFALLVQLFELQAGGGTGKGPVLTLPVGI